MRKLLKILLLLIIVSAKTVASQSIENERFRIYGNVIDNRSNKPVKKMLIKVLPYNREVRTDNNGKFLLNMPKGEVSLVFDDYPFDEEKITFLLDKDTTLNVLLTSTFNIQYLEEVEIIANKTVNDKPASMERLDKKFFQTLPAMLGERDLIKALSLTSGVTSSSEGAADMQVRGGTHGQNLYLLNDVPLYFTQHALGLTSAYNPSLVQNATLYKSGFPAWYGGKVSSVLAVNTIEPTLQQFSGELEIGLISSKLLVNFPLVKDKLGAYFSGRVSNFSPFLGLVNTFTEKYDTQIGITFSDINAGIKYNIDQKNRLTFDFFRIGDNWNVRQKDQNDITSLQKNNSQINGAFTWYAQSNENVLNKLTFYSDHYLSTQANIVETLMPNNEKRYYKQEYGSSITAFNFTDRLSWNIRPGLILQTGASYKLNFLEPLFFTVDSVKQNREKKIRFYPEASLYVQSDISIAGNQKLSLGVRGSAVGQNSAFFHIEPRFLYQIQLPNDYSVSASYSVMSQPIHRIANSGLGFPLEVFVTSSESLKPETSWITSIGGGKEITANKFKLSLKADAWYKNLNNILEFYDGMDAYTMFMHGYNVYDKNQQIVTAGRGKSYGLDLSLSFSRKNTSVFADYTLMRAVNKFNELNNGNSFAASTDIRNTLSATVSHKLSLTWLLSTNWQFNSGHPITVPTQVLPNLEYNLTQNSIGTTEGYGTKFLYLYEERNNYRTRSFHKLDVSLTKNFLVKKKYQGSITFGVYNAYNQLNPFLYSISEKRNADNTYYPVLNSVSVFPVIPSFSFRMKF